MKLAAVRAHLGRIRYRLLAVNLLVLLVPVAGLEFARLHERQLLRALEQDMRNQSVLLRRQIEADGAWDASHAERYETALRAAARDTRTRVRLLDARGQVVVDSHGQGAPEGLDMLVSRLLELGRLEAADSLPTTFDLRALLARVAERAATPAVAVEVDYRLDSQLARARERDLETALSNMLDNAVRHAPEGTVVTLDAAPGDDPREVCIGVRDRGPGVPPALQEKIFRRFFTTDEARHGTGLGLAIAAAVAQSHGGSLPLESCDGPGARFCLRLPLRAAARAET